MGIRGFFDGHHGNVHPILERTYRNYRYLDSDRVIDASYTYEGGSVDKELRSVTDRKFEKRVEMHRTIQVQIDRRRVPRLGPFDVAKAPSQGSPRGPQVPVIPLAEAGEGGPELFVVLDLDTRSVAVENFSDLCRRARVVGQVVGVANGGSDIVTRGSAYALPSTPGDDGVAKPSHHEDGRSGNGPEEGRRRCKARAVVQPLVIYK